MISGATIWPFDFTQRLQEIPREHANHLVCFLACPFKPDEKFRRLHSFVSVVCGEVGQYMTAAVTCIRADTGHAPTVIHEDVWMYLQGADAVIVDVTGLNPNVLFELGVVAGWRAKDQVILIQEKKEDVVFPFDFGPARQLLYEPDPLGGLEFRAALTDALIHALTPAPFEVATGTSAEPLYPLGETVKVPPGLLVGPAACHRRVLVDGLEFGSFYVFRNSWLSVGRRQYRNVRVTAEMRFTAVGPEVAPDGAWLGIMLRSQHFFANFGHLVYMRPDGLVFCTVPVSESAKRHEDQLLGRLSASEGTPASWIPFELTLDDSGLRGRVGDLNFIIPISDMPYVGVAGVVRFQSFRSRAAIRQITITQFPEDRLPG